MKSPFIKCKFHIESTFLNRQLVPQGSLWQERTSSALGKFEVNVPQEHGLPGFILFLVDQCVINQQAGSCVPHGRQNSYKKLTLAGVSFSFSFFFSLFLLFISFSFCNTANTIATESNAKTLFYANDMEWIKQKGVLGN